MRRAWTSVTSCSICASPWTRAGRSSSTSSRSEQKQLPVPRPCKRRLAALAPGNGVEDGAAEGLGEQLRHGVADLGRSLFLVAFKDEVVGERLKSRAFAQRDVAVLCRV